MSNRLAAESSPYLLQHADNPVHWHPWDDEALNAARNRQLPILLSIGYSACHWCHVMAHESFEDEAVAAVMNEHFVCIKVDREERPDLDRVYQAAHQLLTQQTGGWPLTVFLDPDSQIPFYAGTYFPRAARHGLPGFIDVLLRVSQVFAERREELQDQGNKITVVLDSLDRVDEGATATDLATLEAAAREQLTASYDSADGGFGSAPKFPMPSTLGWLLSQWALERPGATKDRAALDMVMTTLTKMARGGIRDHLGGGFCRYATDRRWMIPHFEKMLCDNGQLLSLYANALGLGEDALFADAVTGTADWLLADMRHAQGGFYAALDADSEGQEGNYYVWRRDDVRRLLDEDEYLLVETLFGLDKPANFEGRWNLHRYDAWRAVVERLSLTPAAATALLGSARKKLLTERRTRVPPARDEKILTGWNGLAIRGLADASARLSRPDWLLAAQQAADFLRSEVFVDGTLYATWTNGLARYPAYLDDHAYLLDGLLALLSVGWRDQDVRFARALAESLIDRFEDPNAGGFYFTAHDQEPLIYRPKPVMDDATPAGNAIAASALFRLGHLLGEKRYLDSAERSIEWGKPLIQRSPAGHCSLLWALALDASGGEVIIIRGPQDALADWQAAGKAGYRPFRQVYAIPNEDSGLLPAYLPKLVSADLSARPVAYVCSGFSCSLPVDSMADFQRALAEPGRP